MADKLIQDLGTTAFALTDLLEKQPVAGPPSTKGNISALITLLNTVINPVMRGSGPPVAAPVNPAIGAIYYDDDVASPSYDTGWHWSVPQQLWIGA